MLKLFGGVVSWLSRRQSIIALLTTKVEYIASTHARKEVVWLKRLCSNIRLKQQTVRLDCDSQSEIFLAKNHVYNSRMKLNFVQYHFVRDMVEINKVLLEKVDTSKSIVDSLTKFVHTEEFTLCRESINLDALLQ